MLEIAAHRPINRLAFAFLLISAVSLTPSGAETDAPAPDLRVVGWAIDDTLEGNGDGGLHPGETATLEVWVRNVGTRRATNVSITLKEAVDHPDVEILDKLAFLPDLPQDAQAVTETPHLRLRVAASRPCGWEIPLEVELRADDGFLASENLELRLTTRRQVDLERGDERLFIDNDGLGDEFGTRIASGDFDGDGIEDLVFGVPKANNDSGTLLDVGRVVVVYGTTEPRDTIDISSAGLEKTTIVGEDEGDRLGSAIAVGNFDGSGGDDIAVGIPGDDGEADARSNAGAVHIYSGTSSRPATISSSSRRLLGPSPSFELGQRVALGDVNGDGLDDLVAGSNPTGDIGEIFVVYGSGNTFVTDLSTNPPSIPNIFESSNDGFGANALSTGDLDGDGDDEVLVGRPFTDGGGKLYAILGQPEQLPSGNVETVLPLYLTLDGESRLGYASTSGDFDGDGFDDLAVTDGTDGVRVVYGGPDPLGTLFAGEPGESRVRTIRATTFEWDIDLGVGDDAGEDCLSAGDFDGDGFDELAIGSFGAEGREGAGGAGRVAVIPGGSDRTADIDLAHAPQGVAIAYGASGSTTCQAHFVRNFDGRDLVDLVLGSKEEFVGSRGSAALIQRAAPLRYRSRPDTYAFIDARVGTLLDLACDDCGTTIEIGFPFEFFGETRTEVTVSSNGYLTFGGDGDAPGGRCFPSQSTPNEAIAVFWDDLDLSAGGAVYSLLEGEEPSRRLTLLWDAVPHYADGGAVTFEVTLFETSGRILMQYDDVDFTGTSPSDFGGNAIVGVENAPGRWATTYSCFAESLSEGLAVAYRPFDNPTAVFVDDFEAGSGNWDFESPWHIVGEPSCSPSSHSGESSAYFGYDFDCTFDGPGDVVEAGSMDLDTTVVLEQDSELFFWSRRQASPTAELSNVTTNDGSVLSVVDDNDTWRPSAELVTDDGRWGGSGGLDLSEYAGSALQLTFTFDSITPPSTQDTGWMVDDVTLRACPVHSSGSDGVGAASEALATAQPSELCTTDAGRLDALGSYCTACDSLTYQWIRDGSPIAGATNVTYPIPAGAAPGTSTYAVEISCVTSNACDDASNEVDVRVVDRPGAVSELRVSKQSNGAELLFTWIDVASADDYVLRGDATASGDFGSVEGTASSGSTGLTVETPPDAVRFYLVAGRNPTCGEGVR